MRTFLSFSLLLIFFSAKAQFSVIDIPKELLEGVNAVVRLDQASYEVLSVRKGKYRARMVVTILNKEGDRYAKRAISYDKLSKAVFTTGNVYDVLGKRIYKLKKSDIIDQSSISGFSVYEDNRVKYIDLSQKQYPYTVEFEYEQEFDFLYFIPNWYVLSGPHLSVQKSVYTVTAPSNLKPRYKQRNFEGDHFSERTMGDKTIYEWKFENVKPMATEPYGPGLSELAPMVYVAPSKFEFEGYTGDMSTWDGIAEWQRVLNRGREALPQETIDKITELVAPYDNDRDKIKAVYEYLQSNTRYVSIQLGIGGFQPFEAEVVDDLGYGDCKALSFYTQSLLRSVGIKSHYTWVEADDNPRPLFTDFANDTFNHIILCVPNKGDTVWLECTSQTKPFGYMGTFTGDRDVLLVTEDGGKIVHTPVYDESVNIQARNAMVTLSADGSAKASVTTSYQGLKYEYKNLNFIVDMGETEQKKWVAQYTELANFDLDSYEFEVNKGPIPEAKISAEYTLSKYARANGKRLFLAANLMNRIERLPKPVEDRKTDFIQKNVFTEIDSITYTFDENFKFEYVPEGAKVTSKFGEYESSIVTEQGKLTFVRKYVLKKGRYPAEDYEKYRNFLKKVIRADAAKVVLNGTT